MGIEQTKKKKQLVTGILAHVDAGKTTLSESMLYKSGAIRKLGRVDHKDAFLDTFELERERGITIFSKQAVFTWKDMEIILLDTPGHVDFSAEMERTLQVLDYAVLIVSGSDGIQGHTVTLWKLLKQYDIPVFIFVNKMDQTGADKENILHALRKKFGNSCIDFSNVNNLEEMDDNWKENLAVCEEKLLEGYLETGNLDLDMVKTAIKDRSVFPCYFGSALKQDGIEEFLDGFRKYTIPVQYPDAFGAKVYKIARDDQDNRLTYLKVTGGTLSVKDVLPEIEEKVDQIRIYSGAKFEPVQEVKAGGVCAVIGPEKTYPGQGLGIESAQDMTVLEPVLTYQIQLPPDCDVHKMLLGLKQLEEEEPQLHIVWEEQVSEIHVQLMGEVQIEVLKRIIWERFKVRVEFGEGKIVYKETIEEPVEGIGHFEPLRHYAEVHLFMEPGERGSGLVFDTNCSEEILDRNWQRLVMTHLEEKEHKGVLTGAPITDMKITLIAGRSHKKHTDGGDFRQATYRAVRQGLRKAKSILLEPWYEFRMELPPDSVGRAMTDIQNMHGKCTQPITEDGMMILTGMAPVSFMRGYQKEFLSYTGGHGRMFFNLKGYEKCYDQDRIVEETGYDPESDILDPTGSVFCAHGAGFIVPWYQVEEYMHVESPLSEKKVNQRMYVPPIQPRTSRIELTEEELDEIYATRLRPSRNYEDTTPITIKAKEKGKSDGKWDGRKRETEEQKEQYLLVDGYNIIFAWDDLKELAEVNIESARDCLMDILSNYQGYKKCTLILVFDAYKVQGNLGEVLKYHNIYVVYTKEAETADQYIEKTVQKIGRKYQVTVATSDALEQVIIMGKGAHRMSAAGLKEEVKIMKEEIRKEFLKKAPEDKNYLFDHMDEKMVQEMEKIRLGKRED